MDKQSSPKKGLLLPPDQLERLVGYFSLLIDIDQKNKKNLRKEHVAKDENH